MKKYNLAQAAAIICGEQPMHRDPERWLADQLRAGRFRGHKVGRYWYMTDADITAAEQGAQPIAPAPAQEPFTLTDGLSARSRRRLRTA